MQHVPACFLPRFRGMPHIVVLNVSEQLCKTHNFEASNINFLV